MRTRLALCTSTIGVSPATVIVSDEIADFHVGVDRRDEIAPDSSMPSRLKVLNPVSENVTV